MVLDASKTNPQTDANKLVKLKLMRMVLDAAKTNPLTDAKKIGNYSS
jgi:hypothetical protein